MPMWITNIISLITTGNVFIVLSMGLVCFFCWFCYFLINKLSKSIDKMSNSFSSVALSIEKLITSQSYLEKTLERIDIRVENIKDVVQSCRGNKNN